MQQKRKYQKQSGSTQSESNQKPKQTEIKECVSQSEPQQKQEPFFGLQISEQTKVTLKKAGFEDLFDIQKACYTPIFEGKNIIGQDQTGSGKTLAFLLPVMERLRQKSTPQFGFFTRNPWVIILAPTWELANQIGDVVEKIQNKSNEFICQVFIGGASKKKQIDQYKQSGADIIIGTPGRITDLIDDGIVNLSNMQIFILDETDKMMDQSFQESIQKIYDTVYKAIHKDPSQIRNSDKALQVLLFSATMTPEVKQFIDDNEIKSSTHINMSKQTTEKIPNQIEHFSFQCFNIDQKLEKLKQLLNASHIQSKKIIVFGNLKEQVTNLAEQQEYEQRSLVLHGDIPQLQREFTLKQFRDNKIRLLFATDVIARGIDVSDVDLIIMLAPSLQIDQYVHRCGRTGRAGKTGKCLTYYLSYEKEILNNIQQKSNVRIKDLRNQEDIFPQKEDQQENQVENLLNKLDLFQLENQQHLNLAQNLLESVTDQKDLTLCVAKLIQLSQESLKDRKQESNIQDSKEQIKLFITFNGGHQQASEIIQEQLMRHLYKSSLRKVKINYQEPVSNHFEMLMPKYLKQMIMDIGNDMHTKIQVVETVRQRYQNQGQNQKQYTDKQRQAPKETVIKLALNKQKLNS